MVIILSFGQTGLGKHVDPDQIKEQSGQSPHCLSFHLHLYSMVKPHCSDFKIIAAILWVSEFFLFLQLIWAVSWQNQQNDCVPSEDSDQPGQPPSLIPPSQRRLRSVRMKKAWILSYLLSAQRRHWSAWASPLIRLGRCSGWSESSLGAQSFCWFCHETHTCEPLLMDMREIWFSFQGVWGQ